MEEASPEPEPDDPMLFGMEGVTLAEGTVLGPYVVQRMRNSGMGGLYEAYDPEDERRVVIRLRPESRPNRQLLFCREAAILAKLSHPNLVRALEVGTFGDHVWHAAELVEGKTLRHVKRSPLGWRDALAIMLAAGRGLAAAHRFGATHGDFHPGHVMLADDGRVLVKGLGSWKIFYTILGADSEQGDAENGSAYPIVGNPSYFAPEQITEARVTSASDQYSFCVALWEAVYGERPFSGRSVMEVFACVLEGKRPSPPTGTAVPAWLRRACERGLSVDPADRWPSMDALLDRLAQGSARARARMLLVTVGGLALLGLGGWLAMGQ